MLEPNINESNMLLENSYTTSRQLKYDARRANFCLDISGEICARRVASVLRICKLHR